MTTRAQKDRLHAELEALTPAAARARHWQRMVIHALIELEQVTRLECAYEDCSLESRLFGGFGSREKDILTIDHIISKSDGGTDLPSNLQLMHHRCNSVKGQIDALKNDSVRARISETSRARWQDPTYVEKARVAQSRAQQRPDVVARKSASMRASWADPEVGARRAANTSKSDGHWSRVPGGRDPEQCPQCPKVCVGSTGLKQHMTKMHKESVQCG